MQTGRALETGSAMKTKSSTLKNNAMAMVAGVLVSTTAAAEMQWRDSSFTLLHGEDYELDYSLSTDDSNRDVITFEHVSGHSWGDLFLFVDRLHSRDGSDDTYAEISPRASLGKLSGSDWAVGPVKDLLLAATLEMGSFDDPDKLTRSEGRFHNLLTGVGVDLAVPGFTYVQANLYHRNNDYEHNNEQLTVVWGLPFKLGAAEFMYDGFADWTSATEDQHSSLNVTSQLKLDLGAFWGKPKKLYAGIEYVHWNDKFGVEDGTFGLDTNERNINLILKFHL